MMVAPTSTRLCRASEISARLPMAMPTANFAAAMAALAKMEIAATRDLIVGSATLMSPDVAVQWLRLKRRPGRTIAMPQTMLRIVPDINWVNFIGVVCLGGFVHANGY